MDSLYNPATLGPSQSVLIRGVASFQGWICTIKTFRGGLNAGVASFQGSRLERVYCITSHWFPWLLLAGVVTSIYTTYTTILHTNVKSVRQYSVLTLELCGRPKLETIWKLAFFFNCPSKESTLYLISGSGGFNLRIWIVTLSSLWFIMKML